MKFMISMVIDYTKLQHLNSVHVHIDYIQFQFQSILVQ